MEKAAERIAKLPEPIQKHVYPDDPYWCYVPKGWRDLVCKLNEHLEAIEPDYVLHQVKEKFGGLRYYTLTPDRPNDEHDLFWILVSYYENLSFRVCDKCGERGRLYKKRGYIRTRCEEHADGGELVEPNILDKEFAKND